MGKQQCQHATAAHMACLGMHAIGVVSMVLLFVQSAAAVDAHIILR